MVLAQTRISPWQWDTQNFQEFWDAKRTPYPIQKTRPGDNNQNKRETAELWTLLYRRSTEWKSKKTKREKITEKVIVHESGGDTYFNRCAPNSPPKFGKNCWRVGSRTTNLEYSMGGHSTKKNSGDWRRLAVTRTVVKDHQLMLDELKGLKKTLKW